MIASASSPASVGTEWRLANGAGDYNADGSNDLLWRHTSGLVAIWLLRGGQLASAGIVAGVDDTGHCSMAAATMTVIGAATCCGGMHPVCNAGVEDERAGYRRCVHAACRRFRNGTTQRAPATTMGTATATSCGATPTAGSRSGFTRGGAVRAIRIAAPHGNDWQTDWSLGRFFRRFQRRRGGRGQSERSHQRRRDLERYGRAAHVERPALRLRPRPVPGDPPAAQQQCAGRSAAELQLRHRRASTTDSPDPQNVAIAKVAATNIGMYALATMGAWFGWGSNTSNKLRSGSTASIITPVQVQTGTNGIVDVAAGEKSRAVPRSVRQRLRPGYQFLRRSRVPRPSLAQRTM